MGNVSLSGAVATNVNRVKPLLTLIQSLENTIRSSSERIRRDALPDVIFALIANGASPDIDRETLLRQAACNILKDVPPRDLLPLRVFAASLVMLNTLQQQSKQSENTAELRMGVRKSISDLLALVVPKRTQSFVSEVIRRHIERQELSKFVDMLYKRKIVKPRNPLSVMILRLEKPRAAASSTSLAAMRSAAQTPTRPRERPDSVGAVVRELQGYVTWITQQRERQQQRQSYIPYKTEALIEKLRAPIAPPKGSKANTAGTRLMRTNMTWFRRLGLNRPPATKNELIATLNATQKLIPTLNHSQRNAAQKRVRTVYAPAKCREGGHSQATQPRRRLR
jgi:predicted Zn-ribbon and HTH transcriptional regulator